MATFHTGGCGRAAIKSSDLSCRYSTKRGQGPALQETAPFLWDARPQAAPKPECIPHPVWSEDSTMSCDCAGRVCGHPGIPGVLNINVEVARRRRFTVIPSCFPRGRLGIKIPNADDTSCDSSSMPVRIDASSLTPVTVSTFSQVRPVLSPAILALICLAV
jgi:hypothetical protein